RGLGPDAHDFQVAHGRRQRLQLVRVHLHARRYRLADDRPRAARVLALDRGDIAADDPPALGVDFVIVERHLADLTRIDLEQVRCDPVGELGGEVGLHVYTVGPLRTRDADVALA